MEKSIDSYMTQKPFTDLMQATTKASGMRIELVNSVNAK